MKTKTLIFMVSLSTICFTGYACDLEDQDKTENVVVDNNSETTDDSNNSQNITVDNFTEEELDKAATAKGTTLSQEEQKVIQLCNLARLDGNKFMEFEKQNKQLHFLIIFNISNDKKSADALSRSLTLSNCCRSC